MTSDASKSDADPGSRGTGPAAFVDLQLNGAGGYDLTTDPEAVWQVGAVLPRFGVAAFLPTLVSPSFAIVDRAREALAAGPPTGYAGATPLGWHVEGPFLAPSRSGAHDPATLRAPDLEAVAGSTQAALVDGLLGTGRPVVTVALRTPWDLAAYPRAATHVCTYSILPESMAALASALFGARLGAAGGGPAFPGRLPVSIAGIAARGHGQAA